MNNNSGKEIGVGLISVGWMGKLHTRAYQALPFVYPELGLRPRLVHAVDTAPERAEYAREVLGYEKTSSDYHDVLSDPDVDVVSICAPTGLHREIGVAAAEAGKHFWIEKPVGRDAAEAAEVAVAAARRVSSPPSGTTTATRRPLNTSVNWSLGETSAGSPTSGRCSSTATPQNLRGRCHGGSSVNTPAPAPSVICSATSSTWCNTFSGRSTRSTR